MRPRPRTLLSCLLFCAVLSLGSALHAAPPQPTAPQHATRRKTPASPQRTANVVMLSDIHFDPFRDPAKLASLRQQPIIEWPAVLSAPASPTQAADVAALQQACNARAFDTDWPLLQSALAAAHTDTPRPLFLAIPGDLLAHEFQCRYTQIVPSATPEEIAAFGAKTVTFVLQQLRTTYPGTPVFATLGNNDSGCGDYRETPGDAFLQATSAALAEAADLPPGSLTPTGDYSVALPAPMASARLVVLGDNFESRRFSPCNASADPAQNRVPEQQQLDWLRGQLQSARDAHQHVWVMGHIPPGVDIYASFRQFVLKPAGLCSATPVPFLADTALPDTLLDYADTVTLGLFGHTHMDEWRVLQRPATAGDPAAAIPEKSVPSVSPFVGNHPSFVSATVDTHTAVLKDWRTLVSPGAAGSSPPWAEGYRFTTAFHAPDFSGAAALRLADLLAADKSGQGPESTAFRRNLYPGDFGLYAAGVAQIWPAYACGIRENRPSAVQRCICQAVPLKAQDFPTQN